METFGCPTPGKTQHWYNRWAFAHSWLAKDTPPRHELFRTIADQLVPGLFEWHDWTLKMVEGYCYNRWNSFMGASGCVSGDTRILMADTGEYVAIEDLHANGIAPTVMTLSGPAKAGVPWIKGVAQLFEVRLANGQHFQATAEHRVLVQSSSSGEGVFVHVGDLQIGERLIAYEQALPRSNSGASQQARWPSGPCSPKTTGDSRGDYQTCSCSDGGRLRSEEASGESFLPSQDDAQEYNRTDCTGDDLDDVGKHSPFWSQPGRPSNSGFDFRGGLANNDVSLLSDLKTTGPGCQLSRSSHRSHSANGRHSPFLERVPDFCGTPPACGAWDAPHPPPPGMCECVSFRCRTGRKCLSGNAHLGPSPEFRPCGQGMDSEGLSTDLSQKQLFALPSKVSPVEVVSITATSKSVFYDISVPGPEHYFAEGTIHHNSAKTFNAASIACVSWLCAPRETCVICCSTTMKGLRGKLWPVVTGFHKRFDDGDFGLMTDSEVIWQVDRGDRLHAIFGLAVSEGKVKDMAANIQGYHATRQIVLLDEAEAILPPIWIAMDNLYRHPHEFVVMPMFNPWSRLSYAGRYAEPERGYQSVGLDSRGWKGKPQADGEPTHVVRFDFVQSPNVNDYDRQIFALDEERFKLSKLVDDESKAKVKEIDSQIRKLLKLSSAVEKPSKYLPDGDKVRKRLKTLMAKGALNDPGHWCFDRAFPAPEGLIHTVFSSATFERPDAYGQHQFTGEKFTIIGVYDPARTGDRPTVRFAALGQISGGRMGIEWMEPIILFADITSDQTISRQLAQQVIANANNVQYRGKSYRCEPRDFGMDCTGDGAAAADAVDEEWQLNRQDGSVRVVRIMFQGAASERPASRQDGRPSNEVYGNKRAEMWYSTAQATEVGQVKGVDQETAAECCEMQMERKQGLIYIEDKKIYKGRTGISPDLGDTGMMLTEIAMQRGFIVAGLASPVAQQETWLDKLNAQVQEYHSSADYRPDYLEEMADALP